MKGGGSFGDRNPINSPSRELDRDCASLVFKDGVRVCVVRVILNSLIAFKQEESSLVIKI